MTTEVEFKLVFGGVGSGSRGVSASGASGSTEEEVAKALGARRCSDVRRGTVAIKVKVHGRRRWRRRHCHHHFHAFLVLFTNWDCEFQEMGGGLGK